MAKKSSFLTVFTGLLLFLQLQISAEAGNSKTFPCHSGKVVSTSVIMNAPKVLNLEGNTLPSKVKDSNAAYAKILMAPDPGRSLGVYDYVLVDQKGKEYPCIAIKEGKGDFDAANWSFDKCKPGARYTLLFKIEYPSGRVLYNLKYQYPISTPEITKLSLKLSKGAYPTTAPKASTPATTPKPQPTSPPKTTKTTREPTSTTSNKSSHSSKKKTSDSASRRHKKKQKK